MFVPMGDQSKNEGLQAARAVAALSVAYFHSYIALRAFPETAQVPIGGLKDWGFLGVNFFFAISGYVICLVVSRPGFAPIPFAIRRVFRLYPMYWATMAVIVVLIALGKYRLEPIGHFLYSMTLLPQQTPPAFDPSWTLEREMVFYALAMVTVPLGGIRALAIVLAALAGAGWYFGNPWSFHLVSSLQADFLAGVLAFLARDQLRRISAPLLLMAGVSLLVYTRTHEFAFSVSISSCLILAGMVELRVPWQRAPFSWLVALGDASYSIYLLHYVTFAVMTFVAARLALPEWACEPWRALAIGVCCLISLATWQLIERPMIRFGNRLAVGGRLAGFWTKESPAVVRMRSSGD
jgi:exopolysaccharide production protein ExoZ